MLVQDFLAAPLQIEGHRLLLEHAWHITIDHGRRVYDSLYLALADKLDIPLVTADSRFFNAPDKTAAGKRLLWIETSGM